LRVPAWLVVGGADASAEAVLGLAAYVHAGGTRAARTALAELAGGIAAMGQGSGNEWPYGAILPSVTARSIWHAWAAQMSTALAAAAAALNQPKLLRPAIADAAAFTPRLLAASGPDNGLMPAPVDGSQIAYGADARVQALLSVAQATHSTGLRQLAGLAAGWFFGQNLAGAPTYNPQTGATDDGVSPDGTLNLNSGAESTIHGLLTMEALDANPDVAEIAKDSAQVVRRDGQVVIEAEAATLSGAATVAQADPVYTGEGQWSGGAYVQLSGAGSLSWTLPAAGQPRLLEAIVNRVPGSAAVSSFTSAGLALGTVAFGGGGAQGISPTPGALLPVPLAKLLPAGATALSATSAGGSGQLDAIALTPLLSTLITSGNGHGVALIDSVASATRGVTISLPGTGTTTAGSYDSSGRLWRTSTGVNSVSVSVPGGGFAIVRR
jgi:hypothetical protein